MERRYWKVVAILVLYCTLIAIVCYVDVLPQSMNIFEDKHTRFVQYPHLNSSGLKFTEFLESLEGNNKWSIVWTPWISSFC